MAALPRLRDFDNLDFNPFFEESAMFGDHLDPYPKLAELRARGPVVEGDFREFFGLHRDLTTPDVQHYMITNYQACSKALLSPEIFSNKAYTFNLGASFGASVRVSDVTTNWCTVASNIRPNMGDYIGSAAGANRILPAWADGRNGVPDTFFSSGQTPGKKEK